MEVFTIAIMSLTNILCFVIGAKVGQTIVKGERVEIPNLNPFKAIRESNARKVAEMEMDKMNTILRNVERYDGSGKGQEDVN